MIVFGRMTAAVLACLLMAGCTGAKVYKEQYDMSYLFLELMARHGGKDMRLEVVGNPYDANNDDVSAEIGAAMSGRNRGLPITFTSMPRKTADAPTKIVILFNPPPATLGHQVCAGNVTPMDDKTGRTAIISYCERGRDLSTLWLDLPPDAAIGSPGFVSALALATEKLLPVVPPTDTQERCLNC